MEPISLTVAAIAAGLATKAADRAAEVTVEGGESVLRRVVARVRERFSSTGDADATRALELVAQAPDSRMLVERLAGAVDRHVTAEPRFASELARLVAEVQSGGVDVGSITQVVLGDRSVQIAGVSDSQISISHADPQSPRTP